MDVLKGTWPLLLSTPSAVTHVHSVLKGSILDYPRTNQRPLNVGSEDSDKILNTHILLATGYLAIHLVYVGN